MKRAHILAIGAAIGAALAWLIASPIDDAALAYWLSRRKP